MTADCNILLCYRRRKLRAYLLGLVVTVYSIASSISRIVAVAPPKFLTVQKCSLCREIFFQRKQNVGLEIPIWGTLRGKIEILSTHNLLCRKFATVCSSSNVLKPRRRRRRSLPVRAVAERRDDRSAVTSLARD